MTLTLFVQAAALTVSVGQFVGWLVVVIWLATMVPKTPDEHERLAVRQRELMAFGLAILQVLTSAALYLAVFR